MNRRTCVMFAAWCFALSTPLYAADQDTLAAARDLYASAAYEDALSVLDRLPPTPRSPEDARAIAEYRAFCLLALGRTSEAEHAIEILVTEQPNFQPAAADVSPRVRATFADVRRRVLPSLIEKRYADAKGAFDRKEFAAASQGFQQVLAMMSEPGLETAVSQPPLSDLRTLAMGFRDLAVSETPPPPLPTVPVPTARAAAPAAVAPPSAAPAPTPATIPATAPAPAATSVAPRVYLSSDPGIVQPITIRQELPAFPGTVMLAKKGVIELIIDENGSVESAVMRVPVSAAYDALALTAAKTWRYRPATLDGKPVRFRKSVQITVKPGRS